MSKILQLALAKIHADQDVQARCRLCEETAEEYAEALRGGAHFAPIVTFWDRRFYWLADGFHRLRAHALAGCRYIETEVHDGAKRDAILHAVSCNVRHGLRPTRDDNRRAVTLLLTDLEWRKWADAEIARRCGVSRWLVSQIRDDLSCCADRIETYVPTARKVERNGKTFTMALPVPRTTQVMDEPVYDDRLDDAKNSLLDARMLLVEVGDCRRAVAAVDVAIVEVKAIQSA